MGKLLVGTSIICIVMVLAGVDRGFDISDEGLYVLLADPQQQNVAGVFNYDLIFKLIFQINGYSFSLVELRIIRLLSYFVAAWALAGFWKNIKGESSLRTEIFCVGFLALMAGYAFLPPTLSYNSLTVVLICCWLQQISVRKMTRLNLVFTGAILSLLLYIKVTVALIFFPLTFLILIFRRRVPAPELVLLVLPLILSESVFYLCIGENALSRLADGVPLSAQRPGYQIGMMIKSVAVGGLWTGLSAMIFLWIGIAKRAERGFFRPALLLGVLCVGSICYFTHITEEWNHLVLICFAAVFGFYLGEGRNVSTAPWLWVGCLLLLPFFLHLGSNVYWLRIGIHYSVFWVFAFMISFDRLQGAFYPVIASLSVLLIFNGIWWHPFGQEEPLWKEKIPWNRTGSEVVQLDPDLAAILNSMNSRLPESSQPILAAYRIPGLVWLSGKQMPHSPGIWDPSQLPFFFNTKPEQILYNELYPLPSDWQYLHSQDLGVYQGDSIQVLWD